MWLWGLPCSIKISWTANTAWQAWCQWQLLKISGIDKSFILYSVSQNKVPSNVWFFFWKLAKSYQTLIGYSKAWFISLQGNFEFLKFGSGNQATSIWLKYPNFAFVQGSVDLVIKVQISKSVITMAWASHTGWF